MSYVIPYVCNNVCTGDIMSGRLQGRNRPALTNMDLKECEIIHKPKNDENFTSLINAGPPLNAGFK